MEQKTEVTALTLEVTTYNAYMSQSTEILYVLLGLHFIDLKCCTWIKKRHMIQLLTNCGV